MMIKTLSKGLVLAGLLPSLAHAGHWFLPEGSIACLTAESFALQRELVKQNRRELAVDCGTTKQQFDVELLAYSFFSDSRVRVIDNDVELWTFSSALEQNRPSASSPRR